MQASGWTRVLARYGAPILSSSILELTVILVANESAWMSLIA